MSKEHDIVVNQYNKVRAVINSIDNIKQVDAAKKLIHNLGNWWVTDILEEYIKPFKFNEVNEPINRIGELENLLNKKISELQ